MFGRAGRGAHSLSWGWARLHSSSEDYEDSDSDLCGACGRMRYQHDEDSGCEFQAESAAFVKKKRKKKRKQ